jgi:hypothetical protein
MDLEISFNGDLAMLHQVWRGDSQVRGTEARCRHLLKVWRLPIALSVAAHSVGDPDPAFRR